MADIFCVPPDRAAEYWDVVKGLIRPALENSLTDFDVVARAVCNGEMLLWLIWDGTEVYAAVVTQLSISNGKKFCTIVAIGGHRMPKWLHTIARIEKFARDEGCKSVAIMGRFGWSKLYPDYKVTSTTIQKELA